MTLPSQLPQMHRIGRDLKVGKGFLSLFNSTSQPKLEASTLFLTDGHSFCLNTSNERELTICRGSQLHFWID